MITEDYVSYDVAKLIKEKGYSGKCVACYDNEDHTLKTIYTDIVGRIEPQDWNNLAFPDICKLHLSDWYRNVSAPTYQSVMKWLRDELGIIIIIEYKVASKVYTAYIVDANGYVEEHDGTYKTYEEATEAILVDVLKRI